MNDKIKTEDTAAVEEAPAPPHPRSDSAAKSPRDLAGGSPCRDEIDDLVDASLERGPTRYFEKCQYCSQDWHGTPNPDSGCQGSHLKRRTMKKPRKPAVVTWESCYWGSL